MIDNRLASGQKAPDHAETTARRMNRTIDRAERRW
jgi:hypothetical protein